jgi:hypothetical protein
MNDFTKEELRNLISTISTVRIYTDIDNYDDDLYNKIQSMIENYCEHESAHIDYDYQALKCNKCKEIVE